MGIRLCLAMAAIVLTAGCGLTGSEPTETPQHDGRITIADKTRNTQSVSCTQTEWLLSIEVSATPGRASAALQLGGDRPIVQTVAIENIDGLNGVADADKAEAAVVDGTYTITGTAVVSVTADPGQSTTAPFRIEAPC